MARILRRMPGFAAVAVLFNVGPTTNDSQGGAISRGMMPFAPL
jgi:hypothetical protein